MIHSFSVIFLTFWNSSFIDCWHSVWYICWCSRPPLIDGRLMKFSLTLLQRRHFTTIWRRWLPLPYKFLFISWVLPSIQMEVVPLPGDSLEAHSGGYHSGTVVSSYDTGEAGRRLYSDCIYRPFRRRWSRYYDGLLFLLLIGTGWSILPTRSSFSPLLCDKVFSFSWRACWSKSDLGHFACILYDDAVDSGWPSDVWIIVWLGWLMTPDLTTGGRPTSLTYFVAWLTSIMVGHGPRAWLFCRAGWSNGLNLGCSCVFNSMWSRPSAGLPRSATAVLQAIGKQLWRRMMTVPWPAWQAGLIVPPIPIITSRISRYELGGRQNRQHIQASGGGTLYVTTFIFIPFSCSLTTSLWPH